MSNFFDYSHAFIKEQEIKNIYPAALLANDILMEGTGSGNDYLGWIHHPDTMDRSEIDRIKKTAQRIQKNSQALIVIGIGGSYMGAKAMTSALTHTFQNELTHPDYPKIYFAGQNISATYLSHLIDIIKEKEISINVISKSGTTTEPAIAFRILKNFMEKKYGRKDAAKRIVATTDAQKGALKAMAENEGYETFIIPDDIGGRYSVHTAVGLLPLAVAGIDIDAFMDGAKEGVQEYSIKHIDNPCFQYASARNILYRKDKSMEILVNYEPGLKYFSEWWKQLYGESEGKDGKGIFPVAMNFSTDLHSLGQIVQEGKRNMFETIIHVENMSIDLEIPFDENNQDGLNYLIGKTMNDVNKQAFKGTLYAHLDGDVPNLMINLQEISAFSLGKLVYFFEKSCALSGYLLGVNPFDQPGVESYKKNMFGLLGKPGYEEIGESLLKRDK
ncbi:MAG: glucose-6-phosphate isomerase [Eubacteriales bacterium]